MRLLDLPEAARLNERERHRMALEAATRYTQLMGFQITPEMLERGLPNNMTGLPPTLERQRFDWESRFKQNQFDWQRQNELAQLQANPRYFAQYMLSGGPTAQNALLQGQTGNLPQLGMTPAQVAEQLQASPLVQQLTQGQAQGQLPGQMPRNPLFQFISGRQMPVRQTLGWQQTGSQNMPLVSSLASFSGQEPENFWKEFQSYLPQGGRNPLTRFA